MNLSDKSMFRFTYTLHSSLFSPPFFPFVSFSLIPDPLYSNPHLGATSAPDSAIERATNLNESMYTEYEMKKVQHW